MISSPRSEATAPERRAFIFLLGASNLAFLVVDRATGADARVLIARLVLSAILLGAPALLPRLSTPAVRVLLRVLGVCVSVAFGTIAWATGGTAGPYFVFLPMLALVYTVAVPDEPWGSLLTGVAAAAIGLARAAAEQLAPADFALWATAFASATAYGIAGALLHRRQRAREARLDAERARVVEELAESERRRARAERLALVGHVAGSAAHDLANPLAFVRTDVGALEEALAAEANPEVKEILADVRVGLDRMRQVLEDLRGFAREGDEAPARCELAAAVDEALRLGGARLRTLAIVERALPEALPPVRAARARIVHAVLRLVADVADVVDVRRRSGGASARVRIRVSAAVRDGWVELALEDDVAGAPADARSGGLAVALAREEVEAFGGAVEVRPREGGGSIVVVRLPVAGEVAAPVAAE